MFYRRKKINFFFCFCTSGVRRKKVKKLIHFNFLSFSSSSSYYCWYLIRKFIWLLLTEIVKGGVDQGRLRVGLIIATIIEKKKVILITVKLTLISVFLF